MECGGQDAAAAGGPRRVPLATPPQPPRPVRKGRPHPTGPAAPPTSHPTLRPPTPTPSESRSSPPSAYCLFVTFMQMEGQHIRQPLQQPLQSPPHRHTSIGVPVSAAHLRHSRDPPVASAFKKWFRPCRPTSVPERVAATPNRFPRATGLGFRCRIWRNPVFAQIVGRYKWQLQQQPLQPPLQPPRRLARRPQAHHQSARPRHRPGRQQTIRAGHQK